MYVYIHIYYCYYHCCCYYLFNYLFIYLLILLSILFLSIYLYWNNPKWSSFANCACLDIFQRKVLQVEGVVEATIGVQPNYSAAPLGSSHPKGTDKGLIFALNFWYIYIYTYIYILTHPCILYITIYNIRYPKGLWFLHWKPGSNQPKNHLRTAAGKPQPPPEWCCLHAREERQSWEWCRLTWKIPSTGGDGSYIVSLAGGKLGMSFCIILLHSFDWFRGPHDFTNVLFWGPCTPCWMWRSWVIQKTPPKSASEWFHGEILRCTVWCFKWKWLNGTMNTDKKLVMFSISSCLNFPLWGSIIWGYTPKIPQVFFHTLAKAQAFFVSA